jgi:hypothetical protein
MSVEAQQLELVKIRQQLAIPEAKVAFLVAA